MDRESLTFAAAASAAVPGLEPVSVESVPSDGQGDYDVAYVHDASHRRYVARVARTTIGAARMEAIVPLLTLMAPRVPVEIPRLEGMTHLSDGRRVAVYPLLPGAALDLQRVPPGDGLAADIGRVLAAIHDVDPAVIDEAGLPTYDADMSRQRRYAQLDRLAEAGSVRPEMLGRWEQWLDDVSLWQFAPTPVHGALSGDHLLAVFADADDAASGSVRSITGWEDAHVGDPAEDFADLVTQVHPDTLQSILDSYRDRRSQAADDHLVTRARLIAELSLAPRSMRHLQVVLPGEAPR